MKRIAISAVALVIGLATISIGPVATANAATGGYAMVKGTILKETGNPLSNTTITVGVGDCEDPDGCGTDSVVAVKTDEGGHYHARVLVTGNPYVYVGVPSKGPYRGRSSAYIKIAIGKSYTKNLTVHKETMFSGKVTDADGTPLTSVLTAYSAKNNLKQDTDVTVGDDGGYFHLSLPEGAYKIKIKIDTNGAKASGIVTSWYGAATKDAATIVRMKAKKDQRAKIVFLP
jgi:hypothetical protein